MSQVVIVSGPPGAGKSSVCEALCERYDRTVHLETDDVYGWIRMGFVRPWMPGSQHQNEIVARACARAAAVFAQQGYGVFIDGVIQAWALPIYLEQLVAAHVPVHYVVLLPSLETVRSRAASREKWISAVGEMYERTHATFAAEAGAHGVTIDSSDMTALETADAVMAACGRGEALILAP